MDLKLAGRVAVITGPAKGMGAAITRAFAAEGSRLALIGRDIAAIEMLAEEVRGTGAPIVLPCDLTDAAQCEEAAHATKDRLGRIDILVNVAGGALAFGYRKGPLEDATEEQFRRLVDLNLHGPFLLTCTVIGQMKTQRYGRILLVSSGAGRGASRTGIHGYAAAKAGLLGFVRQVAREAGEFGITINSVAPGLIDNPRVRRAWDEDTEAGRQAFFDGVAVKRLGTAADIASAILYFVSPQAAYTTGQTLLVDGGHLMF